MHDSEADDEVAHDAGAAHDDDDGHDKDRDEDDNDRYILARLGAIWRCLGLSWPVLGTILQAILTRLGAS